MENQAQKLTFLPFSGGSLFDADGGSHFNAGLQPGGRSYLATLPRPIGKLMEIRLVGAVIAPFLIVFFVAGLPFGVLYMETHESPTLGCNSCHNVSMGARMGIPPKDFKDRNIVPLVDDNHWMVEHWFYPQVAW